jgi:hypothetical protein
MKSRSEPDADTEFSLSSMAVASGPDLALLLRAPLAGVTGSGWATYIRAGTWSVG